ncbi:hypothetical protein EOM09_09120, partial [bacterium]|nr:hypothetical protein [bacterium]
MDYKIKSAQEFDGIVNQYNEWLKNLDTDDTNKANLYKNHPVYFKEDLSIEQKTAILIASDFQRIKKTLEDIISKKSPTEEFSIDEAISGKKIIDEIYNHFKDTYI